MQLIIKLNGTSREMFEKNLQNYNWQYFGQFQKATNNKNVLIAQKQEWEYDIKVCYYDNNNYDYFVLFTPLSDKQDLFDKEPWRLESLVKEFVNFINVDYNGNFCDKVECALIQNG